MALNLYDKRIYYRASVPFLSSGFITNLSASTDIQKIKLWKKVTQYARGTVKKLLT